MKKAFKKINVVIVALIFVFALSLGGVLFLSVPKQANATTSTNATDVAKVGNVTFSNVQNAIESIGAGEQKNSCADKQRYRKYQFD